MTSLLAGNIRSGHILAAIVVLYLVRKLIQYRRLRQFPGPRGTGISDLPHTVAYLGPAHHEWYRDINEKYGPVARVGPKTLVTSSPDVWTHVNIKQGYKRSAWYYEPFRFEYRQHNIFSQTDNEAHDERRKQMAPGYSGRENLDLEPAVNARVVDLLTLIRTKYLSTEDTVKPMELSEKVKFLALDIISTVGLGQAFGMLRSDSDVSDYLQNTEDGFVFYQYVIGLGLGWIFHFPWLGRFLSPTPNDNFGFGKIMAVCYRMVDDRVAKGTEHKSDMIASWVRHGLFGAELHAEALESVIAGADTTASGLRGILLYTMTSPRVCAKLQREIDDAVRKGMAPREEGGVITYAQAKKLPYLQAVVREGLRIWPPVLNFFPRDVPAGGDTVCVDGKYVFLPGGTCIGYSGVAMHRNRAVYGDDADAFRPERWFEKDPDKLAAMTRASDLVFGHGRWMCLGKPVAQIELSKVIFELLRNFDFALLNPPM